MNKDVIVPETSAPLGTPCPLYTQPEFRLAAGRSLRPGGPVLTRRGLALCGLLTGDSGEGRAVLDVGCGAGATLELLVALGFTATGVDPSPALLAEAASTLGGSAVVLPGTAAELPVPDASQDGVVCECVLSLTPDPDAALAAMARALKPGGALLLSDIFLRGMESGPFASDGRSCLSGAMDLPTLRGRLRGAGFVVLAEEDHSRLLAELAARLIFAGESWAALARWLGSSCSRPSGSRDLSRRFGYLLVAAKKA